MKVRNISNDRVSSVMVPYGYSVEFFANDAFVAPSMIVNGDVFEDSNLQMKC